MFTRKLAHKRNPLNAATVGNPLLISHTFKHTGRFTVEINYEWKEYGGSMNSASLAVLIETLNARKPYKCKECGKS